MFILYDLIFFIILLIYLPIYLFRGKFHRGFLMRLGFLPKRLEFQKPIWIHAVSVGEAVAIKGLVEGLRKAFPGRALVFSTVTPTGNRIALKITRENDAVIYFPLDFSFIVKRVIKKINPCLVIIAETEIWPNFISCLNKNRIPLISVNARISDRSFQGYLAMKPFIKDILKRVSLFCCQTDNDAKRLKELGVAQERIKVAGNLKFDLKFPGPGNDLNPVKEKLGLTDKGKILVAASTHRGEEEIILSAFRGILKDSPLTRLIIAPRHPERAREVEKLILNSGFSSLRISNLFQAGGPKLTASVVILDSIGQLMDYYSLADVVFVGGSLIKKGGHNIIEPAALGKPVLFGPYMFNFKDIAESFINNQAAILVRNKEELSLALKELFSDAKKREELSANAARLINQNQGATQKTIEYVKLYL